MMKSLLNEDELFRLRAPGLDIVDQMEVVDQYENRIAEEARRQELERKERESVEERVELPVSNPEKDEGDEAE